MVKLNLDDLVHARLGQQSSMVLEYGTLKIGDFRLAHLAGVLNLTRVDDGILAKGDLEAAVETECARCLKTFFEPVLIELEDIISLPDVPLTPERPTRVDEGGKVNLDPLLYQHIWLGFPLNPVCSEDCRGLCPRCGGDIARGECVCTDEEPVDPRWEQLRELLDETEP